MIKKSIITTLIVASAVTLATAQTKTKPLTLKDTIKDPSIQVPKDIENNLDQLVIDWNNLYKKDPSCGQGFQADIVYPDSVYIERLYSLPSEMELAFNQIVKTYIDMYTSTRRKNSVGYMLAKGDYYFPIIEETLDRYGLPLELKYLAVIESALNPTAKSRAGATGLWQFMLRTGQMYDLEVNTLVDERKDPRKATEAAARYLKDLYDIYNDWNLVIAAYNCGPGNVNKAIRRSGGLTDYWAIYPYLPRETRGYVPGFIAATYIMNYYPKHDICPAQSSSYPTVVDTLWIDQHVHLKQISNVLNIPLDDIKSLNPQYQKDIIPGNFKKYPLCLPAKQISDFISNQNSIFTANTSLLSHRKTVDVDESFIPASGSTTKTHKIKTGESLGTIARKYGVSVAHLKKMNNLKSNNISAGKTLVINRQTVKKAEPPKTNSNATLAQNKTTDTKSKPIEIDVAQVDTTTNSFFANYYNKARLERDSINEDLALNVDSVNVNDDKNEILDRNNFEDARTIYHKVKIGETVLQIANKYDVSSKEIQAWNNLSSKKVKIGQRLMIKLPAKDATETEITEAKKEDIKQESTTGNIIAHKEKTPAEKENKYQTTYMVKKGDTLSVIAQKFKGVSTKDILLANNLRNDRLSIGQKLKIPLN